MLSDLEHAEDTKEENVVTVNTKTTKDTSSNGVTNTKEKTTAEIIKEYEKSTKDKFQFSKLVIIFQNLYLVYTMEKTFYYGVIVGNDIGYWYMVETAFIAEVGVVLRSFTKKSENENILKISLGFISNLKDSLVNHLGEIASLISSLKQSN